MEKLRKRIHDDSNGLDYVLVGDYYIPALKMPEESRPLGGGAGCTRHISKDIAPASMPNYFCRGTYGRISLIWTNRPRPGLKSLSDR